MNLKFADNSFCKSKTNVYKKISQVLAVSTITLSLWVLPCSFISNIYKDKADSVVLNSEYYKQVESQDFSNADLYKLAQNSEDKNALKYYEIKKVSDNLIMSLSLPLTISSTSYFFMGYWVNKKSKENEIN